MEFHMKKYNKVYETYIANSGTLSAVQERDKIVGRMRNNGAEHAGNVTADETHPKLKLFAALVLGRWD